MPRQSAFFCTISTLILCGFSTLCAVEPNRGDVVKPALANSAIETRRNGQPNILFVLVDDLGWSDLGCYGSRTYETPHVDRLAQRGMRFTDFYAAGPVCSPTRASILTGKYPARTGVTTYLLSPDRDPQHVAHHLELDEFTIAEAFHKHGYATGYFGKWHLGYSQEHWAAEQGFETAVGGMDLPWAWQIAHPDRPAPSLDRRKGHTRFFSPYHLTFMDNGPPGEYLTDRLTDETIRFIETNKDGPFFAFLSFHTVHTPLQAKPDVVTRYRKKIQAMGLQGRQKANRRFKHTQDNPAYAAMVQHMDENIGRLLAKIDQLDLTDKTIVVFTSDNGGKGSVTSNLPLNGAKHDLREGGIRVPLIVRWPAQIQAATRSDCPLISNDFYPTLLDLAGVPLETQQHLDGVSFRRVLIGNDADVGRDALYWHYPHNRREAAIRMRDFKLIKFLDKNKTELYNLRNDLGETHDLSAKRPNVTKRMLAKLTEWQSAIGSPTIK